MFKIKTTFILCLFLLVSAAVSANEDSITGIEGESEIGRTEESSAWDTEVEKDLAPGKRVIHEGEKFTPNKDGSTQDHVEIKAQEGSSSLNRSALEKLELVQEEESHEMDFKNDVDMNSTPKAPLEKELGQRPFRDPFSYTDHMKSLKFDPHDLSIDETVVLELIPRLALAGIVRDKNNTTMAILNIKDQDKYVVRAGDVIPLQRNSVNTFLKIKEVSQKGIVAQVGDLGTDIYVK